MSAKAKKENPMLNMLQSIPMTGSGSLVKNEFEEKIIFIDVKKIVPYHNQARKIFDEKSLQDLANSIESQGIIQPLQVIPSQDKPGIFEVISGERRLRAAIMVGLNVVPCMVLSSKKDVDMVALIENIQRTDLHPLERAAAFADLIRKNPDRSHSKIAKELGVSKQLLSTLLKVYGLPQDVKDHYLKTNTGSLRTLVSLARLQNEDAIRETVFHTKATPTKHRPMRFNYDGQEISTVRSALNALQEDERQALKAAFVRFSESL